MSDRIINTNLEDVISDRISRYSKYIIQDRALPDVRDGLKPVQRRILFAMDNEGNTFDKPYRKSAKTVGLVIGNYHPHGDTSVYDAMVRMAQDWKMRAPLIDMQGNKGSIDDDPAAAMRYTEARLAEISKEIIGDIDSDTVNFILTYDDKEKEPTVLPARFLNILVNGAKGIAYGYATDIPTHNLKEVTNACIRRLNNPSCTLSEIMQDVKGPDFPTGGIVYGSQGLIDAFTTGKGRVIVRAKITNEEKKGNSQLIITEIPYDVIKMQLVKKIKDIRLNKEIDGLLDVRDESDRNGLRIVIDLKKDADSEAVLNYLYKNTQLQIYYNYNIVCIVDKKPMQLGLINIIDAYLGFYEDFTIRLTNFEIRKLKERTHILEGLIKAISVLDEVIKLIRASKDKGDAKNRLMIAFSLTELQAEAIVMLQLYRLTNTDIVALRNELELKLKTLAEKEELLTNREALKKLIASQLQAIADKYGDERRTQIEDEFVEITIDQKALIASERVMVSISKGGYVKQSSLRSFKASDNYPALREGDQLIGFSEVDTLDTLVVSAKSGAYACLNVHDLSENKWKDIGDHVNKYVNFAPGDNLVDAFVVRQFTSLKQVLSVTSGGQIRRCLLSDYERQIRSKTTSSLKIKADDELVRSLLISETDEIALVTSEGYILRYLVNEIPLTSMNTQGVRAIKLGKDDRVVDMQVVKDTDMLGIFANNGTKRIRCNEVERTNRGKKGVMLCRKNKSNPVIINAVAVGGINDKVVVQNGDFKEITIKDLTLMDLNSSFSSNLKFTKDYQILRNLQLLEVKVEDDNGVV